MEELQFCRHGLICRAFGCGGDLDGLDCSLRHQIPLAFLGSDAVFAVKDSLICDFVRHEKPGGEAARLGIDPPFYTAHFDFRLKAATEQGSTVLDAQQRLAALGART